MQRITPPPLGTSRLCRLPPIPNRSLIPGWFHNHARPSSHHIRPRSTRERDTESATSDSISTIPPPLAAAATSTQLFSNLNPKTLRHEPGTVLGSALLVAGTTVGAGILALPAVTSDAGFLASTATITACCAFSMATGNLKKIIYQEGRKVIQMLPRDGAPTVYQYPLVGAWCNKSLLFRIYPRLFQEGVHRSLVTFRVWV